MSAEFPAQENLNSKSGLAVNSAVVDTLFLVQIIQLKQNLERNLVMKNIQVCRSRPRHSARPISAAIIVVIVPEVVFVVDSTRPAHPNPKVRSQRWYTALPCLSKKSVWGHYRQQHLCAFLFGS